MLKIHVRAKIAQFIAAVHARVAGIVSPRSKPSLSYQGARQYIENFRKFTVKGASYARLEKGRIIKFDEMTDDEAVEVAGALIELEVVRAENRLKEKDN